MKFQIGPHTFRAVVSDRAIYDAKGQLLEGCAIEGRRLIIVSLLLDPDRREEVLRHEIVHAWEFFCPAPTNEEQRADFHAFVAQQFQRDYDAQGGRDALLAMATSKVPTIGAPPGVLSGSAREIVGILRRCLELVEREWDRFEQESREEVARAGGRPA